MRSQNDQADEVDLPTLGQSLARQQAEMRALLYEFMAGPRMQALLSAIYERAAAGHVPSLKLLLQYGLGLPKKRRRGTFPRLGPSGELTDV
jgi:hypothetical protein